MPVQVHGPPAGDLAARIDVPALRRLARRLLAAVGHARSELSLALVDDGAMRALNRDWRGRDRPTDVLSFSLLEGPGGAFRGRLLGDVVISVDTAARQARARRRSLADELARLLIHGLLHLLGHDHERDDDARRMQAEERRLRRLATE